MSEMSTYRDKTKWELNLLKVWLGGKVKLLNQLKMLTLLFDQHFKSQLLFQTFLKKINQIKSKLEHPYLREFGGSIL